MTAEVLIVVGGSRGIGAEIALRAAREWTVCLTYRADRQAADGVVSAIDAGGGRAMAVRADVSQESDVVAAFAAADTIGPISGAVINAGIVAPKARVEEMSAERIGRMFAVNSVGAMLCCREAVKRMSTRHGGGGGSIVLVSSSASRLGAPGEYVETRRATAPAAFSM